MLKKLLVFPLMAALIIVLSTSAGADAKFAPAQPRSKAIGAHQKRKVVRKRPAPRRHVQRKSKKYKMNGYWNRSHTPLSRRYPRVRY